MARQQLLLLVALLVAAAASLVAAVHVAHMVDGTLHDCDGEGVALGWLGADVDAGDFIAFYRVDALGDSTAHVAHHVFTPPVAEHTPEPHGAGYFVSVREWPMGDFAIELRTRAGTVKASSALTLSPAVCNERSNAHVYTAARDDGSLSDGASALLHGYAQAYERGGAEFVDLTLWAPAGAPAVSTLDPALLRLLQNASDIASPLLDTYLVARDVNDEPTLLRFVGVPMRSAFSPVVAFELRQQTSTSVTTNAAVLLRFQRSPLGDGLAPGTCYPRSPYPWARIVRAQRQSKAAPVPDATRYTLHTASGVTASATADDGATHVEFTGADLRWDQPETIGATAFVPVGGADEFATDAPNQFVGTHASLVWGNDLYHWYDAYRAPLDELTDNGVNPFTTTPHATSSLRPYTNYSIFVPGDNSAPIVFPEHEWLEPNHVDTFGFKVFNTRDVGVEVRYGNTVVFAYIAPRTASDYYFVPIDFADSQQRLEFYAVDASNALNNGRWLAAHSLANEYSGGLAGGGLFSYWLVDDADAPAHNEHAVVVGETVDLEPTTSVDTVRWAFVHGHPSYAATAVDVYVDGHLVFEDVEYGSFADRMMYVEKQRDVRTGLVAYRVDVVKHASPSDMLFGADLAVRIVARDFPTVTFAWVEDNTVARPLRRQRFSLRHVNTGLCIGTDGSMAVCTDSTLFEFSFDKLKIAGDPFDSNARCLSTGGTALQQCTSPTAPTWSLLSSGHLRFSSTSASGCVQFTQPPGVDDPLSVGSCPIDQTNTGLQNTDTFEMVWYRDEATDVDDSVVPCDSACLRSYFVAHDRLTDAARAARLLSSDTPASTQAYVRLIAASAALNGAVDTFAVQALGSPECMLAQPSAFMGSTDLALWDSTTCIGEGLELLATSASDEVRWTDDDTFPNANRTENPLRFKLDSSVHEYNLWLLGGDCTSTTSCDAFVVPQPLYTKAEFFADNTGTVATLAVTSEPTGTANPTPAAFSLNALSYNGGASSSLTTPRPGVQLSTTEHTLAIGESTVDATEFAEAHNFFVLPGATHLHVVDERSVVYEPASKFFAYDADEIGQDLDRSYYRVVNTDNSAWLRVMTRDVNAQGFEVTTDCSALVPPMSMRLLSCLSASPELKFEWQPIACGDAAQCSAVFVDASELGRRVWTSLVSGAPTVGTNAIGNGERESDEERMLLEKWSRTDDLADGVDVHYVRLHPYYDTQLCIGTRSGATSAKGSSVELGLCGEEITTLMLWNETAGELRVVTEDSTPRLTDACLQFSSTTAAMTFETCDGDANAQRVDMLAAPLATSVVENVPTEAESGQVFSLYPSRLKSTSVEQREDRGAHGTVDYRLINSIYDDANLADSFAVFLDGVFQARHEGFANPHGYPVAVWSTLYSQRRYRVQLVDMTFERCDAVVIEDGHLQLDQRVDPVRDDRAPPGDSDWRFIVGAAGNYGGAELVDLCIVAEESLPDEPRDGLFTVRMVNLHSNAVQLTAHSRRAGWPELRNPAGEPVTSQTVYGHVDRCAVVEYRFPLESAHDYEFEVLDLVTDETTTTTGELLPLQRQEGATTTAFALRRCPTCEVFNSTRETLNADAFVSLVHGTPTLRCCDVFVDDTTLVHTRLAYGEATDYVHFDVFSEAFGRPVKLTCRDSANAEVLFEHTLIVQPPDLSGAQGYQHRYYDVLVTVNETNTLVAQEYQYQAPRPQPGQAMLTAINAYSDFNVGNNVTLATTFTNTDAPPSSVTFSSLFFEEWQTLQVRAGDHSNAWTISQVPEAPNTYDDPSVLACDVDDGSSDKPVPYGSHYAYYYLHGASQNDVPPTGCLGPRRAQRAQAAKSYYRVANMGGDECRPIDVTINGETAYSALAGGAVTEYRSLAAGIYEFDAFLSTETTSVIEGLERQVALQPHLNYTVVVCGSIDMRRPLRVYADMESLTWNFVVDTNDIAWRVYQQLPSDANAPLSVELWTVGGEPFDMAYVDLAKYPQESGGLLFGSASEYKVVDQAVAAARISAQGVTFDATEIRATSVVDGTIVARVTLPTNDMKYYLGNAFSVFIYSDAGEPTIKLVRDTLAPEFTPSNILSTSSSGVPTYKFEATLDGHQVVPIVDTAAVGHARFSYDPRTKDLHYDVFTTADDVDDVLLYTGVPGEPAAELLVRWEARLNANINAVGFVPLDAHGDRRLLDALPASDGSEAPNYQMFVVVTTAAHPNGELRGQLQAPMSEDTNFSALSWSSSFTVDGVSYTTTAEHEAAETTRGSATLAFHPVTGTRTVSLSLTGLTDAHWVSTEYYDGSSWQSFVGDVQYCGTAPRLNRVNAVTASTTSTCDITSTVACSEDADVAAGLVLTIYRTDGEHDVVLSQQPVTVDGDVVWLEFGGSLPADVPLQMRLERSTTLEVVDARDFVCTTSSRKKKRELQYGERKVLRAQSPPLRHVRLSPGQTVAKQSYRVPDSVATVSGVRVLLATPGHGVAAIATDAMNAAFQAYAHGDFVAQRSSSLFSTAAGSAALTVETNGALNIGASLTRTDDLSGFAQHRWSVYAIASYESPSERRLVHRFSQAITGSSVTVNVVNAFPESDAKVRAMLGLSGAALVLETFMANGWEATLRADVTLDEREEFVAGGGTLSDTVVGACRGMWSMTNNLPVPRAFRFDRQLRNGKRLPKFIGTLPAMSASVFDMVGSDTFFLFLNGARSATSWHRSVSTSKCVHVSRYCRGEWQLTSRIGVPLWAHVAKRVLGTPNTYESERVWLAPNTATTVRSAHDGRSLTVFIGSRREETARTSYRECPVVAAEVAVKK